MERGGEREAERDGKERVAGRELGNIGREERRESRDNKT